MAKPLVISTVPQPAFLGLNKERQQVLQDPSWCIEAQNTVVDGAGRMAARRGRDYLTTNAVESGAALRSVFEYVQVDSDVFVLSATATKLYSGTTTLTDITGTVTQTAGRWQFVNFNGNVYGWQRSHTPIVWTGTGNFAHLTAATGTLPDGDCVAAAFGRLWGLDDDKQTIRYSALLDATKWATADGGGSIDMRSVWTRGTDEVIAITSYGSFLVVFGKRHIVMWTDGAGSNIGLDPTNMYVTQSIEGMGCIARDSVQQVGELDVIFWSDSGVRSLQRTLQEKPTPVNDLSGNIREFVNGVRTLATTDNVRSVHSPKDHMYLLIVPDANVTLWFDTRGQMENGALRVCEWPAFNPTAACARLDGTVLFGGAGKVERYFGFDDNGASYRFVLRMPWSTGGDYANGGMPNILKYLKEIGAVVLAPQGTSIVFKWWTDYQAEPHSSTVTLTGGAFAEYNADALYSVAEYSGGLSVKNLRAPVSDGSEHTYISLGLEADINGFPLAVQSLTTYTRPGRGS